MASVAEAFERAPRARFLPPEVRPYWHLDRPLALTHGQTNSQPSTVANMLELLDVAPGQRVLDVGSGSGWTTALLAELVGPEGSVLGLERIPDLVAAGRAALAADWPMAEVRLATPGVLGAPDDGPYDRILVSAEARSLPRALVDQLAEGGILVIPVGGVMHRVQRRGDDDRITRHGYYMFVPLIEG